LIEAQRRGFSTRRRELVVSLGWDFGRALPRVAVADDHAINELELGFVRDLHIIIAHQSQAARALEVAALALRFGATRCVVFDGDSNRFLTTDDVRNALGMRGAT
jgi:hypothetical protein